MSPLRFRFIAVACLVFLTVVVSWAQEPQIVPGGDGMRLGTAPDLSVFSVMKFAGTLKDSSGEPRTGAVGITFAFYSEQSGGAPLWLETQNIQLDSQGRYSALLGATKAEGLPINLFASGEARWLGIQVGTEAELQRILLVSVPYALKAAEAERLGGKTADEFVSSEELEKQVQQAVETQVAESEINLTIPGGTKEFVEVASSFTDTNATQVVLVTQQGTGTGLRATAPGRAVQANSTATSGVQFGVLGSSLSTEGRGVQGVSSSATGATFGVLGQSNSTAGAGVYGVSFATSGAAIGVKGESRSTSGRGVQGLVTATSGNTFGVLGQSNSTSGRGLQGVSAATTGTTYGILGQANSTSGTAIYSFSTATSGATFGLNAEVRSAGGTAALFNNVAGGKLISGISNFAEVFAVSGSGNVTATSFAGDGQLLTNLPVAGTNGGTVTDITAGAGLVATATNPITVTGTLAIDPAVVPQLGAINSFTANQNVAGTVTATAFAGDGSGLTGVSTQAELRIRGINYLAGCDTCDVLLDTDDQPTFFINVVGAMTVNSVTCFADAGTAIINLQRDDGSPANLLSSNLSCSVFGTTTTTFAIGEDILGLNDKLDFVMVTAGGVAKRVLVAIKATVN